MKRKICVVSTSRADFGLLRPLIDELKADLDFNLQLVVSGSHTLPSHGLTYKNIEAEGYHINQLIAFYPEEDEPVAKAKATANLQGEFAVFLEKNKPDVVVILGDRFEILPIAYTALLFGRVIAHISGGEVTSGAIDDEIRHAISKLSNLHFVAMTEYRDRLVRMGEDPHFIFVTGETGLDRIRTSKLEERSCIERRFSIQTNGRPTFLVTFHPQTKISDAENLQHLNEVLKALARQKDCYFITTGANLDHLGHQFNICLEEFAKQHAENFFFRVSLGDLNYLSVLNFCQGVIGNSSSGLVEAPSFGVPTLNIGDRQSGRVKAESVFDCAPKWEEIEAKFLYIRSPDVQLKCKSVNNPYGDGLSIKKISQVLKNIDLDACKRKVFFDQC